MGTCAKSTQRRQSQKASDPSATDTIDHVVTDKSDLTSTSTRTVIIEAPQSPPIVPDNSSTTPTQ